MAAETVLVDRGFDEWARAAVFSGLITFREPAREGEAKPPCVIFVESSTADTSRTRASTLGRPRGIVNVEGVPVTTQVSSKPESEKGHSANARRAELRDCPVTSSSCEGNIGEEDRNGHSDFHTWASGAVFSRLSSLSKTRSTRKELRDGDEGNSSSSKKIAAPLCEKDETQPEPADENGPSAVRLNSRSNSSPKGVSDELPSFDEWATGAVFKNMDICEGRSEEGCHARTESDKVTLQHDIGNSIQQRRRQVEHDIKTLPGQLSSDSPTQGIVAGTESIVAPTRTLDEHSSPPLRCPDRILFEDWAGGVVFNNLSKTVLGTDTDIDSDLCIGGAVNNPDEVENVTRREVSFNEWADEVVFKNIPLAIDKNVASNRVLSDRRGQCNSSPSSQPIPAAALDESIAAQTDVRTNGDGLVAAKSLEAALPNEVNLEQSHPSTDEEKLLVPERSNFEEWASSVIFGGTTNVKEKSSQFCDESLPVNRASKSSSAEQPHLKSDTGSETEPFGKQPKDESYGIKASVQEEGKSSLDFAVNCVESRDEDPAEDDTSRGGSDRTVETSMPLDSSTESSSRSASTGHGRKSIEVTFRTHDSFIPDKFSTCSSSTDTKSELSMEFAELDRNESLDILPGLQDELSAEELNFDFGHDGSHGLVLSPKSENIPSCTHVDKGERTMSNSVDIDSLKQTQTTQEIDESKILLVDHSDRTSQPNEGAVYGHKVPQINQQREDRKKDALPKFAHHSLPAHIRFDYLIPRIVSATAFKTRLEDKVGLVFVDKGHKIELSKMTSRSLYLHSELSVGDELLTVNNHRVKSAEKAAEFIRLTEGQLRLVSYTGKRPRESSLVMLRRGSFNPSDVWLANRNGMVHIVKARGKFCRSIRDGDVLLSVDGQTVLTASRASELLTKPEGSDSEAGEVAIILVFSLAKLRYKLARKLGRKLPFTWNDDYTEASTPGSARLLKIHSDGNVESLSKLGIGAQMLNEIEAFATSFYDCFQQSMDSLHRALTDAAREDATIPHSHSC